MPLQLSDNADEEAARAIWKEKKLSELKIRTLTEDLAKEKKNIEEMKEDYERNVSKVTKDCDKKLEEMKTKLSVLETEMDKKEECKICHFAPRNCIILPCGHFMACRRCINKHISTKGNVCPYCNLTIESYPKVFM